MHTQPASTTRPAATVQATIPTAWTIFLRTFIPWQAIRFVVINLKMFRLIARSHRSDALGGLRPTSKEHEHDSASTSL